VAFTSLFLGLPSLSLILLKSLIVVHEYFVLLLLYVFMVFVNCY